MIRTGLTPPDFDHVAWVKVQLRGSGALPADKRKLPIGVNEQPHLASCKISKHTNQARHDHSRCLASIAFPMRRPPWAMLLQSPAAKALHGPDHQLITRFASRALFGVRADRKGCN